LNNIIDLPALTPLYENCTELRWTMTSQFSKLVHFFNCKKITIIER